mmetsp:Transcript_7602/g.16160  ORF Transcript_7602/g.16160 Transcript_7602/m.16160 type:complete len:330 (-) Transcript_7602:258-1247(-)|eukprot:CAMPEP_0183308706 /NCGR_PEP_ID=MMETSP0160_2-20130417/22413_1 /TAXON_ID=2839 ORGANISM="Odontella Sinensis, Strain Grunow 1884" /NCGR_SAMPLE_ID=MMETSP0160_2 /ASSEMBLY_ACC=CAM_ASM_000250 /LENGTH=329 /DNA_ID=CAMNT_0025472585 /DNA_START=56 /DNA_END=1045 /DNA_ORIENTATION=+
MSKSPSLRRIQADIRELARDPSDRYHAAPLEDDMFEWHFTIRGADDTEFEGGVYHGRILLPAEYPFKPPHIVFLTPSGRFETGTKVCLSFSAYHPELWQPAWGIRLILEALISFLPTPADGAIGSLDWTKEERKRLAKKSSSYCCLRCGNAARLLPELDGKEKKPASIKFQKEIEQLKALQIASETKKREAQKDTGAEEKSSHTERLEDGEGPVDGDDVANEAASETGGGSEVAMEDAKEPAAVDNQEEVTEAENAILNQQPVSDRFSMEAQENVATQAQTAATNEEESMPWFVDPLVHLAIVTFAVLVYLLFNTLQSILEEIRMLDAR